MALVVDERGIVSRSWFRTRHLAWESIDDYRLRVRPGANRLPGSISQLQGAGVSVTQGGWLGDLVPTIRVVLARLHPVLLDRARSSLARDGVARFGPLSLAAHGIQLREQPPVTREAIECVDVFGSYPVSLRVMLRGKVFPHCTVATKEIPNIVAALEIATQLGYSVRGRQLFAALGA